MSTGTYRNDLAAAQMRSATLAADLASAKARIRTLEGGRKNKNGQLQGLLDTGMKANQRKQEKEQRAKQKEELAAKRSSARHALRKRWASARMRRRSMFAVPILASWYLPLFVASLLMPLIGIFVMFEGARAVASYALAGSAAIPVLGIPWGWWAEHREQGRIESLPFRITGHLEALGEAHLQSPALQIHFEGEAPSIQEARALLLGLVKGTKNPLTAMSLRQSRGELTDDALVYRSKSVQCHLLSDNRSYLRWYRKLVGTGAVALHQSYPIHSIHIASTR